MIPCKVAGCSRAAAKRSYCDVCGPIAIHARKKAYSVTLNQRRREARASASAKLHVCKAPGCTRLSSRNRTLCVGHVARMRKKGRLDAHIPLAARGSYKKSPPLHDPPWALIAEEPRSERYLPLVEDHRRPATRAECVDAPRPCPFIGCRHHLALEVGSNGSLHFAPHDIEDMRQTCALDVADAGGATLEIIGDLLGVTRERVRQIEASGLARIRARERRTHAFADALEEIR